jgi:hypothetical protein
MVTVALILGSGGNRTQEHAMNFFKLVPARPFPIHKTSVMSASRIAIITGVAATLAAGIAPANAAKTARAAPLAQAQQSTTSGGVAGKHPCHYGPCPRPIVRDHRTGANPTWVPQQRR